MDASHEAALQRLRDTLESHRWRFATTFVNDLQALLDMLDAAGPLLAAARDVWLANKNYQTALAATAAVLPQFGVEREALHIARERLFRIAAAQQPPAASPEDE